MFVQFIPILIDNLVPELMSELLASQMHSYTLNRGNKYESVIYVGLNDRSFNSLFVRFVHPGMEEEILDGII